MTDTPDSSQDPHEVHAPGLVNPQWPLCLELTARQQGWTIEEIEDGEIAWVPDQWGLDWPVAQGQTVGCRECLAWVHA